jgi:glycosyltransferase involved in cell wall biosynthesis
VVGQIRFVIRGEGATGANPTTPADGVNGSRKVVHLTSAHTPTDVRIFVKECQTLAAAGYEVHLIAPGADDGVNQGVRVHGVGPRRDEERLARMTSTVRAVYRRARALAADLYHFHDPELIPAGLRLARSGAAVVYDVHEDYAATVVNREWIRPRLRGPTARLVDGLEPAAANRLAAVVAATPAIAERFSGCRCEVVTVNNFPKLREFERVQRRPLPAEPAVCYVGSIFPMRGIEVMVDAIARTDAQLLLAGSFDSDAFLERLRASPGWSRVAYLGRVDRAGVGEIFGRASAGIVLLRPSAQYLRSHPTKMFEYMSAGLPVIASDFPLWRDIVKGAGCGLCVDPLSPDALADAITWIVAHPEEAREMGENGRRAIASTYNWEPEGAKLAALYRRLLD